MNEVLVQSPAPQVPQVYETKGKLYYQAQTDSDVNWAKVDETLNEGKNVYLQVTGNVSIWYQVANPNQSDFNQLKSIDKVIAFQHGNPNPPCPNGGCS